MDSYGGEGRHAGAPVDAEHVEPGGPRPSAQSGDLRATGGPGRSGGAGIQALSLPYQVVAAVSLAVVGVLAAVHLGMVFLHVAPANTLSKQHGEAVDDWVLPEFEQNWKLFAPNPLQQNIAVQARAELTVAGGRRTTGWIDLSAEDAAVIRGNPFPSHVTQNELRRAWDFFANWHTDDNRPNGVRGELSERYLRRIAALRLDAHREGGRIERIQLRSATRAVVAPVWSDAGKTDTRTYYRVLPWWPVTVADLPGGADAGRGAARAAGEHPEEGR
ncbi:DUF5819 family protein [Streptomyces sp. LP05-1]|uniref:DUF5819 family protein n=1 Tax=Streptomyces pyxinae TaxID=2970734 RepID=A0ABT2CD40_9ACTN|nr:DUF5819 family protein [Streptomyces sp. LP05-1]MCS0635250.1 DUF5819 family protein [Streptomyces sp. LP05-1]